MVFRQDHFLLGTHGIIRELRHLIVHRIQILLVHLAPSRLVLVAVVDGGVLHDGKQPCRETPPFLVRPDLTECLGKSLYNNIFCLCLVFYPAADICQQPVVIPRVQGGKGLLGIVPQSHVDKLLVCLVSVLRASSCHNCIRQLMEH